MTASPQHFRRVATIVVAGSIVFSACGGATSGAVLDGVGQPATQRQPESTGEGPRAEASTADSTLTTIPPLDERYPELFNEQGCAVGPETPALDELSPETQDAIKAELPPEARAQVERTGEIDLDAMAPEVLGALLEAEGAEAIDCNISGGTPSDPWEFYGYLGRNADRLSPGQVEAHAVISQTGRWGAIGYTVAPTTGGTVTVVANLIDVHGGTLATVSAASPVRGARPGEPIAFELTSDVVATKVASVDYSVTEAAGAAHRGLSILIEGVVSDGDRSIVIGTITNAADVPAVEPAGTVAITDDTRLVDLVEFIVTEPGTNRPIERLEPGYSGTFEVVINDPAHAVSTDVVEAWAYAS